MSQNRIESFVYTGKVLDEHGNWIPLAEQIMRERVILSHLEKGEIFYKGIWTHISSVLQSRLQNSDNSSVRANSTPVGIKINDIDLPEETPEETIFFSSELVSGYIDKKKPAPETDFPPETTEFPIEKSKGQLSTDETACLQKLDNSAPEQKPPLNLSINTIPQGPIETLSGIEGAEEFEETVIFNLPPANHDKNRYESG